jgi:integrase
MYSGRKRTPPKVLNVPYFPMVKETNIRQGFLSDEDYAKLRDALPAELKPLFVVAYATGARVGELLQVRWEQVDFEEEEIVIRRGETKKQDARVLPFLGEDMGTCLRTAKAERDEKWPKRKWVFNRQGEQIKDFRWVWDEACKTAGVPDLHFHDLRRTAVRNLRKAGVPQVVRMKISGHKTDSMERRYSIVDAEDFAQAKAAMRAVPAVAPGPNPPGPA